MRLAQLEAVVESLLFISGEAVPLTAIAQTIEMDKATARAIVQSLADKYEAEQRGIRIVEINGSYQMQAGGKKAGLRGGEIGCAGQTHPLWHHRGLPAVFWL